MTQKLLYLSALLMLCNMPAMTQHRSSGDTLINVMAKESPVMKNDEANRLFLIYLYDKYKEYIVYKNAPYKGLSFEVDQTFLENRFFEQITFGLGAFTWDFKETGSPKVGGLLFDHPLYMGWEFTLYNQFRLTAGTTLLEQRYLPNNSQKTVLFNSFLGLTGKFKLKYKEKSLPK